MKKKIKSILFIMIAVSIIYFVFLIPYISSSHPVVLGFDTQELWGQFIKEFYRLIDQFKSTGELPFYSWNFFLGNNFYAAKSFYVTGNIFVWFGYLFKNLHFFDLQVILHWLMFIISGFTMYIYLSKLKIDEWIKVTCSLIFTFSSYAIFFTSQLQFLSFYALFPLLFAGVEVYFEKKKPYLFILSLASLLFTNYYMVYTISIFLIIYFTFRYYIIFGTFKGFFKSALILVLYYFVGVLISGILTVPTIMFISGNSRIGEVKESLLIFEPLTIYFNLLIGMFVPNHTYNLLYEHNIFAAWYNYEELNLWCSSLFILLLPQAFYFSSKKQRVAWFLLYSVIGIILFIPGLNSMMHGFSEPSFRWTCLIIFTNIYLIAFVLQRLDKINKKLLIKTTLIATLTIIAFIPIAVLIFKHDISLVYQYIEQFKIFIIAALFTVCFACILCYKKHIKILLFLLVCFELGVFGFRYYNDALYRTYRIDRSFINNSTKVLESNENEFNDYLLNLEPENEYQFYRVYVPLDSIYWSYSRNNGVYYNLKGLMTYDSTYTTSFDQMNELIHDGDNWWKIEIDDPNLITMLNTKYAVVVDETELPEGINWRLITDNYRESLMIFRNDDYRPLGTSYNQVISINDYKKINDTNLFLSSVIAEEEDVKEIKDLLTNSNAVIENIRYGGNHILATSSSELDSFVVLGIPYDKGWSIKVNEIELKKYKVNGGLTGILIPKGNNELQMYFTPEGFKIGSILTIIGLLALIMIFLYNKYIKSYITK